jgi:thiol-disulfide isomerase/thioredoxin
MIPSLFQSQKKFILKCSFFTAMIIIAENGFSAPANEMMPKKFKLKSIFSKETKTNLSQEDGYRVIDFWASWCQSCKTNLERLEPLQKKLNHKQSSHQVYAVSVDESTDEAKSFFDVDAPGSKLKSIKKNAWLDTNQLLSNQLKFEGVPYLVVVDPKGKIVMKHNGVLEKSDIKKIESILKLKQVSTASISEPKLKSGSKSKLKSKSPDKHHLNLLTESYALE